MERERNLLEETVDSDSSPITADELLAYEDEWCGIQNQEADTV